MPLSNTDDHPHAAPVSSSNKSNHNVGTYSTFKYNYNTNKTTIILPLSNTDDHRVHPYAALGSSSNKSDHNEGTRVIDLFNKTETNFIKLVCSITYTLTE